jgi:hypothetical protein
MISDGNYHGLMLRSHNHIEIFAFPNKHREDGLSHSFYRHLTFVLNEDQSLPLDESGKLIYQQGKNVYEPSTIRARSWQVPLEGLGDDLGKLVGQIPVESAMELRRNYDLRCFFTKSKAYDPSGRKFVDD